MACTSPSLKNMLHNVVKIDMAVTRTVKIKFFIIGGQSFEFAIWELALDMYIFSKIHIFTVLMSLWWSLVVYQVYNALTKCLPFFHCSIEHSISMYLCIFNGLVYSEQLPSVHNANAFLGLGPSSALNEADDLGKNSM